MKFEELTDYKKDVKNLLKKYRFLTQDIEVVKKVLSVSLDERPPFSYLLENTEIETCIIKVRRVACKAIKGCGVNSGIKLIYALFREEMKIVFIELYDKREKSNEDRKRIAHNFK